MNAPGTLERDEQARLIAKILELIRAAYGQDAQFAITVQKVVKQTDHGVGVAVFSMGTTEKIELLGTMFRIAAHVLEDGNTAMRFHAIDDSKSVQ